MIKTKNMSRWIFLAIVAFTLSACGGGAYQKSDGSAAVEMSGARYSLASVQVTNNGQADIEGLPNLAQVEALFADALRQELSAQNLAANGSNSGLMLNVDIFYERQVAGGAFGAATGLGVPKYAYAVQVTRNGETVALNSTPSKNLDKGMFGNLASMGDWFGGMNPEQEAEDIQLIARKIIAELADSSR